MTVGGIVLCGGQSSRMGTPKAWLPIHGEFMLPRVVRILSDVVGPVVVVAAPGQDVPPLPAEVAVVRDEIAGRGPLAGLAAGLGALAGRVDAVYLSACDVPLLNAAFVRRVTALLGDAAAAVPFIDNRFHPLAAVYRSAVLPHVHTMLAANQLRLTDLFDRINVRVIVPDELTAADPQLHSLRNVNTPDEYEAAVRAAGAQL